MTIATARSYASPATDGHHVFAYSGTKGICYGFNGRFVESLAGKYGQHGMGQHSPFTKTA
jgi:hypothetical protein